MPRGADTSNAAAMESTKRAEPSARDRSNRCDPGYTNVTGPMVARFQSFVSRGSALASTQRPCSRTAYTRNRASGFTTLAESYARATRVRSEEHTSELQSQSNLVCRLLLEKKKKST